MSRQTPYARLTKKLALFVCCAVALLLSAVPAAADNGPHVAGAGIVSDSCSVCHRAHTAQGAKLLDDGSQTALCYTCHGTTGTGANDDVQDGVGYSGENRTGGVAGALRGGGFEYALIDSANPSGQDDHYGYNSPFGVIPVKGSGEAVTSSHSVDSSDQMIWGNGAISGEANYGATTQLRCGSCHDPHGNGNYRILKGEPEDSGVGEEGEVNIDDVDVKDYTTENYWLYEDENSASFSENIAEWCSTCHTRYLAPTDSGHTDSGDAVYKYRHRSNDKTVGGPTCSTCHSSHGEDPESGPPNCVQCHVAHGSNAKMEGFASDVSWPDGTPAGTDSRLLRIDNRGICQMCHSGVTGSRTVPDSCAECHVAHFAGGPKLTQ